MKLLPNVHLGLADPPSTDGEKKVRLISGDYLYYHYTCDGFDDVGWGCGYRTLQTMISHLVRCDETGRSVPSIREIQQTLVDVGDKPASFAKSRDWIGSFEVCLAMDQLFGIPCKILHCPSNGVQDVFTQLEDHFERLGCPIMMGGDRDASSKGILGTCSSGDGHRYLLILDPHYHGSIPYSACQLQRQGYIKWVPLDDLDPNSFYNLCLPQFNALCT